MIQRLSEVRKMCGGRKLSGGNRVDVKLSQLYSIHFCGTPPLYLGTARHHVEVAINSAVDSPEA